ncbi:MAG: zinc ribbon domain-containing protein [Deltaproteobacteria bacterium]|nr:zinc ribbon domain-containing protein [Deltaproteobacteria bacterium]
MENYIFEIIAIAILIGLIPAYIASRKGLSFIQWWIYGTLIFIVALPHSILTGGGGSKICPYCRCYLKINATRCRHCGYDFTEAL